MTVPDRPTLAAVLFDLDDTLTDRGASWAAFVRYFAGGHLAPCDPAGVHDTITAADQGGYRPKGELFADLRDRLPWLVPPTAAGVEAIWRQHFPRCTVVRQAAANCLLALRQCGLRTVIVTNGRTDAQQAKVRHMGIAHLFDAVVTSEAAGAKKPDPAIYHAALGAIAVDPAAAVFVGDNPIADVVGPSRLGLRTVWLTNGRRWPVELPVPDARITAFAELDPVLATLGGRRS